MRSKSTRQVSAVLTSFILCAMSGLAAADANKASLEGGKKLVLDAKCEACHMSKVGGDGSAIYSRKDRRVTVKSKLLPQVERCNSELGLGLFPDDEAAIAAYLNAAHYKFRDE